jgi:hypothetical protein
MQLKKSTMIKLLQRTDNNNANIYDVKWGHAYLEAVKAVFAEQREEPI